MAHHHDQARRHAVPGDVADQHPFGAVGLHHVVVVAADLFGRAHQRRDVAAAQRRAGGHERFLDLARQPHLAPQRRQGTT